MTTSVPTTRTIRPDRALRLLLSVNGASNAVGGAVLAALIGVVDVAMGLPAPLFAAICGFYLVYGTAMWIVGRRSRPRAAHVVGLIAVNPVWAVACLLLLTGGPTTLGAILLGAEAATVTLLTLLETRAYGRSDHA